MATAVETVQHFMSVLTRYAQDTRLIGRLAVDDAVRESTMYASLSDAVEDLKSKLADTTTYPDTATRLFEATGMVIGAVNDSSVDTGAITGANAGGAVIKDAASIVPEDGDMSAATLPIAGSTTPVTYTGADGKSFTFYVKWPDSFTTVANAEGAKNDEERDKRLIDSNYQTDLNTLDENGYYSVKRKDANGSDTYVNSPTYGQMKSAMETMLKGLNTWWLREGAKLNYDSLGLALDGQTIEIKFLMGGTWDDVSALTFGRRNDCAPSNLITLSIGVFNGGRMDSNDSNGLIKNATGETTMYMDRVVAHELVHAVMFATGTIKDDTPQFITEGIADLVQGDDDYFSGVRDQVLSLVNDPATLTKALNCESTAFVLEGYPGGDMFMRFLAKQNLNTTSIVGDPTQAQTFDYNGNNEVITNYIEADTINYNAEFKHAGISSTSNDLIADADDKNSLIIRNVRGKVVNFKLPSGSAYAYMSPTAGEIDGRGYMGGNSFEVIFGANYQDNVIRAGNGGSELWGGYRGNDELYGGAGVDTFIYSSDGGNDVIHNAESQDKVLLRDITLASISYTFTDSGLTVNFTDGGSLTIEGQPTLFSLENNNKTVSYRADYQNRTFYDA